MKSWTRTDWLIIIIFGVLVALFYWRILTPNLADRQSFPPGDFYAQFWAFATFEVRELSAGRLPLWNPYTFAGAPFWADVQSAVFYPPSLLTILLSAPWGFSLFALEVEAIAHFWLAAIFTYLFIRAVTRSRAAAFVAALVFTFSGYLTGYPSQQLAVLEADIWLPLILFFLYRTFQLPVTNYQLPITDEQYPQGTSLAKNLPSPPAPHLPISPSPHLPIPQSPHLPISPSPHLPSLLLAGAAWGMALLAGHPQSALIVAYVSTAYFFYLHFTTHYATRNTQHVPHSTFHVLRAAAHALRHWGLFIATGLALAAIQFIPAVEYTLHSVRAQGTYQQMAGGLPVTDVIQLLLPGQVSLYSPLYVGVAGLLLAAWIPFARPTRHTIFWGAVAIVSLLISFGGNTFLYSPLYLFSPGFSIFRGQERWAFATAFSLSVLAGYGFNQLTIINKQLTKKPRPQTPNTHHSSLLTPHSSLLRLTLYLFLFALLLTFLFFYGLNDTGWTPDSPFYGLLGASTLLTLLLALAWLLWKFSVRLHPTLFTALTAALICFDLFSANWQTNLYPQLPEWHTQIPNVVAAIKNDAAQMPNQPYRVYNEFRLFDNYGVPFEIEDLWGASPLRPNRYDQFLAPPMPIERTWELLNVKYVITWRQELYLPSTIIYQEPAGDGTTYVHRLEKVGPRAWLVADAQIADDATILQKIADPNFDRWQTALLDETNAVNYQLPMSNEQSPNLQSPNLQSPTSNSQISRLTPHASRLTYQLTTPTPALLILSETYYPGWQATVDGRPAPLLRAYYVLRAVPVPAGEHTVTLTFRPLSFTIGAIISGATVMLLVAIFITRRLRPGGPLNVSGSNLRMSKP